ncbi:MAG: glycosyltransferase family 2 protein [Candidatus Vogelbacteria bacterium]|nr:glycosyltransferase family 2 protein [Candidatus Vogelbacteria bacterium]
MVNQPADFKLALSGKKILSFIITYNEAGAIKKVIDDIREFAPYSDIVVIDDCSTDNTVRIARDAGVKVISHLVNSRTAGYAAVKTAMIYAFQNNYDICCQFDGDGQHDAAYLAKIIEPVARGDFDMVIGSRFLGEAGYSPSFARATAIKIFSQITSLIIGQRICDISSGFKANGHKVIRLIALYPHLISDTNEMIIVTKFNGATILETPIKMRARETGKSWFSLTKYVLYPIKTMLYILAVIVRGRNE